MPRKPRQPRMPSSMFQPDFNGMGAADAGLAGASVGRDAYTQSLFPGQGAVGGVQPGFDIGALLANMPQPSAPAAPPPPPGLPEPDMDPEFSMDNAPMSRQGPIDKEEDEKERRRRANLIGGVAAMLGLGLGGAAIAGQKNTREAENQALRDILITQAGRIQLGGRR